MLAVTALAGLAGCASTPAGPDAPASAWSLGPALPRRVLDPGVAALGLNVVVAGGLGVAPDGGLAATAQVDEFDAAVSAWRALPDAPVGWSQINLAAVGDMIYLAGGLADAGGGAPPVAHGETYALDPADSVWRELPAMPPGDERGAAGVVSAPGRIYLFGGAAGSAALATCLEYDVAMQTWSRLPDLPAPRAHLAAMRRFDGTLIVAGGFAGADASEPRGEVWSLPPPGAVPRAWLPRAAMPEPRGGCAYGVVLGQLLCAGGAAGPTALATTQSYDPYNDAWTASDAMPVARTGTPGAAVGGRLFVPGGSGALPAMPTDTLYIDAPLDGAGR